MTIGKVSVVTLGAFLALTVSACAEQEVTKEDFVTSLNNIGYGEKANTQCVIDKMVADGFKLRAFVTLTQPERDQLNNALVACPK